MSEDNARDRLKRVGAALIVFGTLDIGYMIYCIMHRVSYSSSFNIFAVISGIYVWRRHPWYLKWVPRGVAFFAAASGAALLVFPTLIPLDFQLTVIRGNAATVLIWLFVVLAVIAFFLWLYKQFRAPLVLRYYDQNGLSTKAPKYAFLCGAILVVLMGALLYSMTHGSDAHRAIALARAKSGADYRYWVSGINYTGSHGSARVYAYNRTELKEVGVEW
ncbi:MAG TPA: hypothetical protein VMF64_14500 [Steroidobacteraceae bacterium]|nr:hypothetical protein [Steroidobacteraceae bacterium]